MRSFCCRLSAAARHTPSIGDHPRPHSRFARIAGIIPPFCWSISRLSGDSPRDPSRPHIRIHGSRRTLAVLHAPPGLSRLLQCSRCVRRRRRDKSGGHGRRYGTVCNVLPQACRTRRGMLQPPCTLHPAPCTVKAVPTACRMRGAKKRDSADVGAGVRISGFR
jgi:hypothetical protein